MNPMYCSPHRTDILLQRYIDVCTYYISGIYSRYRKLNPAGKVSVEILVVT